VSVAGVNVADVGTDVLAAAALQWEPTRLASFSPTLLRLYEAHMWLSG
jgi:hypothetical protein